MTAQVVSAFPVSIPATAQLRPDCGKRSPEVVARGLKEQRVRRLRYAWVRKSAPPPCGRGTCTPYGACPSSPADASGAMPCSSLAS